MRIQKCFQRFTIPLALIPGLLLGAVVTSGATLQVTADPTNPPLINAGEGDSVQLHSKLLATQSNEENLVVTQEYWNITSVSVSSDDVNWTVIWTGNAATASGLGFYASLTPSDQDATLQCNFTKDGFYMVDVVATANYTQTINGVPQAEGPISSKPAATNHAVVDVTAITVATANGATKTNMTQDYPNPGDQDWGIVKVANTSVIMQVTTSPGTDPVWKQVKWQGGSAVVGHDDEQSYSAAVSQEYKIKPTISGKGLEHTLNLWVIWATITIDSSGTDPTGSPAFPPGQDGGQSLGIQYNSAKNGVAFNNCQIALMTPSGVHNVVSGGCVMKQDRISHDFANGAPNPSDFNTTWVSDGPQTDYYTTKPDSAEKVYAIDGPDDGAYATKSYDTYNNFRDRMEWNGTPCADYAYWDFQGGWNIAKKPQIYFASGGTGQITLPATDPAGSVN